MAADHPESRTVSESSVTLAKLMLPPDANPAGNVHGGSIMKFIDDAAAVAAIRHSRRICVTASIDRIDFHAPVYVGNLLSLKASVNYAGRTSMEVGVRVEAENVKTGEVRHTSSAYLTFVAKGDDGQTVPVPKLIPESDEEKRRYAEAKRRRDERIARRKEAR